MATLLVTYDLNKEKSDKDREKLREAIKSTGSWARLSESSYAVETTSTPKSFYDVLSPHIDSNDNVLVMTLTRPYWGQHDKEVIDWIEAKL